MTFSHVFIRCLGTDSWAQPENRTAVRGIIRHPDDATLLMIHSGSNGDYKFPGGGVKPGESPDAALNRECLEETGFELSSTGVLLAGILEKRESALPGRDSFLMRSLYYDGSVDPQARGNQNLDKYEQKLTFTACWVSPQQALEANINVLESAPSSPPPWTLRENCILSAIIEGKIPFTGN